MTSRLRNKISNQDDLRIGLFGPLIGKFHGSLGIDYGLKTIIQQLLGHQTLENEDKELCIKQMSFQFETAVLSIIAGPSHQDPTNGRALTDPAIDPELKSQIWEIFAPLVEQNMKDDNCNYKMLQAMQSLCLRDEHSVISSVDEGRKVDSKMSENSHYDIASSVDAFRKQQDIWELIRSNEFGQAVKKAIETTVLVINQVQVIVHVIGLNSQFDNCLRSLKRNSRFGYLLTVDAKSSWSDVLPRLRGRVSGVVSSQRDTASDSTLALPLPKLKIWKMNLDDNINLDALQQCKRDTPRSIAWTQYCQEVSESSGVLLLPRTTVVVYEECTPQSLRYKLWLDLGWPASDVHIFALSSRFLAIEEAVEWCRNYGLPSEDLCREWLGEYEWERVQARERFGAELRRKLKSIDVNPNAYQLSLILDGVDCTSTLDDIIRCVHTLQATPEYVRSKDLSEPVPSIVPKFNAMDSNLNENSAFRSGWSNRISIPSIPFSHVHQSRKRPFETSILPNTLQDRSEVAERAGATDEGVADLLPSKLNSLVEQDNTSIQVLDADSFGPIRSTALGGDGSWYGQCLYRSDPASEDVLLVVSDCSSHTVKVIDASTGAVGVGKVGQRSKRLENFKHRIVDHFDVMGVTLRSDWVDELAYRFPPSSEEDISSCLDQMEALYLRDPKRFDERINLFSLFSVVDEFASDTIWLNENDPTTHVTSNQPEHNVSEPLAGDVIDAADAAPSVYHDQVPTVPHDSAQILLPSPGDAPSQIVSLPSIPPESGDAVAPVLAAAPPASTPESAAPNIQLHPVAVAVAFPVEDSGVSPDDIVIATLIESPNDTAVVAAAPPEPSLTREELMTVVHDELRKAGVFLQKSQVDFICDRISNPRDAPRFFFEHKAEITSLASIVPSREMQAVLRQRLSRMAINLSADKLESLCKRFCNVPDAVEFVLKRDSSVVSSADDSKPPSPMPPSSLPLPKMDSTAKLVPQQILHSGDSPVVAAYYGPGRGANSPAPAFNNPYGAAGAAAGGGGGSMAGYAGALGTAIYGQPPPPRIMSAVHYDVIAKLRELDIILPNEQIFTLVDRAGDADNAVAYYLEFPEMFRNHPPSAAGGGYGPYGPNGSFVPVGMYGPPSRLAPPPPVDEEKVKAIEKSLTDMNIRLRRDQLIKLSRVARQAAACVQHYLQYEHSDT